MFMPARHRHAELVGSLETVARPTVVARTRIIGHDVEKKGPSIGETAPPSVPIPVRDGQYTGVLTVETGKSGVYGLLFRADQAYGYFLSFLQRKYLGPQHGGVGDSQELEPFLFGKRPGNDEKPGSIRGTVNVFGLDLPVDLLLFRHEAVKIQFRGWCESFDDIFHRITVYAVHQIEKHYRDFGIRQEPGKEVPLGKVFANGMVVGKVTIVHKRFVHADEWMRATRMPDASAGGIALVGDPDVRARVFHSVVLNRGFGITHNFDNDEVSRVGHDECAFFTE